jgi:hypothetical protein
MFDTVSVSQVHEGMTIFWSSKNWSVVKAELNLLGQKDIWLRTLGTTGPADGHLIFNEDEFDHQLVLG